MVQSQLSQHVLFSCDVANRPVASNHGKMAEIAHNLLLSTRIVGAQVFQIYDMHHGAARGPVDSEMTALGKRLLHSEMVSCAQACVSC